MGIKRKIADYLSVYELNDWACKRWTKLPKLVKGTGLVLGAVLVELTGHNYGEIYNLMDDAWRQREIKFRRGR